MLNKIISKSIEIWIALSLLLSVTFVFMLSFPVIDPFEWGDILSESVFFLSILGGYYFIIRYKIIILDVGWFIFALSIYFDLLDDFFISTEFLERTISNLLTPFGLLISVFGFFKLAKMANWERNEREQTMDALEESERTLKAFLDATTDSAALMDLEGNIIAINETIARSWGKKPSEIIGTNAYANFPPEVATTRKAYHKEIIRTGKPVRFVDSRDGTWFDNNMYPVSNEDGKVEGIAVYSRNITEQRKAEMALIESEEKYSSVVENSNDGIIINKGGKIAFVNAAVKNILGLKPEDMLGKNITDFIIPDDREFVVQRFKDRLAGLKVPNIYEILVLGKDGSVIPVELNVTLIDFEGEPSALIFLRDLTERKNAEKELLENEMKYRSLFENMLNGFALHEVVYNKKGKVVDYIFLEVNEAFTKLTGLKRKNIIGKKVTEVLPDIEKDPVDWIGRYGKVAITGKDIRFEQHAEPLNKWFSVLAFSPTKGKFATIFEDITERKLAAEKLKDSEEQYRHLYGNAPDAYYIIDLKGNFVDGNAAAEEMMGLNKSELIGKNMLKQGIIQKRQLPLAIKLLARNVRGKSTGPDEFTLMRKDGSQLEVEIRTHPVKIKDKIHVLSIARDVSERKIAEKIIKESEEKYRLLIDNIPDVTWSTDFDGRTDFISPNVKDVYGYTPDEIYSGGDKIWSGRVHKDDLQKLKDSYKALFEENKEYNIEYRIKHKNGKWIWLHDRALIHFMKGKKRYAFGVFSDVTDRKKTESERNLALIEAEKANQIKSNFLANMSHEIRTPLNSILGFTDLIESETKKTMSPELKKYFSIIQQSGDRLMSTVHGILDITQIETGTVILNPELIDLKKIITGLITELRVRAEEKQLDIQFISHVKKSTIRIDSYCATQALSNLIDNAIKYTDKGSVTVQLKRKGKKFTASVTDTGIGMSKNFMDRMFDPFTQESEGLSKKYQGIGIGLPLTKRYLDLIGAELKIDSEKGKGSTFTIIFNNSN